jgi:hypothetical protein
MPDRGIVLANSDECATRSRVMDVIRSEFVGVRLPPDHGHGAWEDAYDLLRRLAQTRSAVVSRDADPRTPQRR